MIRDQVITFYQATIIFLLMTNAISVVVALLVIWLNQVERRPIKTWFGEFVARSRDA